MLGWLLCNTTTRPLHVTLAAVTHVHAPGHLQCRTSHGVVMHSLQYTTTVSTAASVCLPTTSGRAYTVHQLVFLLNSNAAHPPAGRDMHRTKQDPVDPHQEPVSAQTICSNSMEVRNGCAGKLPDCYSKQCSRVAHGGAGCYQDAHMGSYERTNSMKKEARCTSILLHRQATGSIASTAAAGTGQCNMLAEPHQEPVRA